jgi:hypothetical protein
MTPLTAALLALATFLAGLYLGHRWAAHDARVDFAQLERRYQKVIRFAEDYIEANAPARGRTVIRDERGAIVDLLDPPTRCGTSALMAREFIEERRQRISLH